MDAILGLLLLLKLSDALRRENMVSASGKLGGVAGVFAGVHIWRVKTHMELDTGSQSTSPAGQNYFFP